jgi:hypothetical protein
MSFSKGDSLFHAKNKFNGEACRLLLETVGWCWRSFAFCGAGFGVSLCAGVGAGAASGAVIGIDIGVGVGFVVGAGVGG